ncbi:hypothetical protein LX36DRAFT_140366 [Colletotrichum falcatum]|nr:hypothetical protein LX36DRAFT_140366 [Colletotrichum falcatum]
MLFGDAGVERETGSQTKIRQTATRKRVCVFSKRPLAARHDGTSADLAAASVSGRRRAATAAAGLIDNPGESVTSGIGGSRKGGEGDHSIRTDT